MINDICWNCVKIKKKKKKLIDLGHGCFRGCYEKEKKNPR